MISNPRTEANEIKPVAALSQRANRMPRSAIREIMSLAAGRSDVIHLEVGEPDFGTPASIIEQAFAAVRNGATRYSGNAGRPSLRAAIASRASRAGVAIGSEPSRRHLRARRYTIGGRVASTTTRVSRSRPAEWGTVM